MKSKPSQAGNLKNINGWQKYDSEIIFQAVKIKDGLFDTAEAARREKCCGNALLRERFGAFRREKRRRFFTGKPPVENEIELVVIRSFRHRTFMVTRDKLMSCNYPHPPPHSMLYCQGETDRRRG